MRKTRSADLQDAFGSSLHVVFGLSAGGTLRQVIRKLGHRPNLVAFADDLSFGPFGGATYASRADWSRRTFGGTLQDWKWIGKYSSPCWRAASASSLPRVVWVSRRSSREYCGFLEWVHRVSVEYRIVDVTDARWCWRSTDGHARWARIGSVGWLDADPKLWLRLYRNMRTPTARDLAQLRRLWKKLRAERSPLRAIVRGELVSVAATHFDRFLIAAASDDWIRSSHVVGVALAESGEDDYTQVGDLVLLWRVRALVKAGVFEARGDLTSMRASEVRLAPSTQRAASASPAHRAGSTLRHGR
jgi:hypothetical protein